MRKFLLDVQHDQVHERQSLPGPMRRREALLHHRKYLRGPVLRPGLSQVLERGLERLRLHLRLRLLLQSQRRPVPVLHAGRMCRLQLSRASSPYHDLLQICENSLCALFQDLNFIDGHSCLLSVREEVLRRRLKLLLISGASMPLPRSRIAEADNQLASLCWRLPELLRRADVPAQGSALAPVPVFFVVKRLQLELEQCVFECFSQATHKFINTITSECVASGRLVLQPRLAHQFCDLPPGLQLQPTRPRRHLHATMEKMRGRPARCSARPSFTERQSTARTNGRREALLHHRNICVPSATTRPLSFLKRRARTPASPTCAFGSYYRVTPNQFLFFARGRMWPAPTSRASESYHATTQMRNSCGSSRPWNFHRTGHSCLFGPVRPKGSTSTTFKNLLASCPPRFPYRRSRQPLRLSVRLPELLRPRRRPAQDLHWRLSGLLRGERLQLELEAVRLRVLLPGHPQVHQHHHVRMRGRLPGSVLQPRLLHPVLDLPPGLQLQPTRPRRHLRRHDGEMRGRLLDVQHDQVHERQSLPGPMRRREALLHHRKYLRGPVLRPGLSQVLERGLERLRLHLRLRLLLQKQRRPVHVLHAGRLRRLQLHGRRVLPRDLLQVRELLRALPDPELHRRPELSFGLSDRKEVLRRRQELLGLLPVRDPVRRSRQPLRLSVRLSELLRPRRRPAQDLHWRLSDLLRGERLQLELEAVRLRVLLPDHPQVHRHHHVRMRGRLPGSVLQPRFVHPVLDLPPGLQLQPTRPRRHLRRHDGEMRSRLL
ncbi:Hypothetical_protein [Hexamita inflata]|uniref:Hypothetical_protein n=1 Tax=Hexamita inflata TaxID=28002 RepID=A0AA86QPZ9_9EUKA|nr:Hypothetical protein HINF_LOCUS44709 [Hexamita inflata]